MVVWRAIAILCEVLYALAGGRRRQLLLGVVEQVARLMQMIGVRIEAFGAFSGDCGGVSFDTSRLLCILPLCHIAQESVLDIVVVVNLVRLDAIEKMVIILLAHFIFVIVSAKVLVMCSHHNILCALQLGFVV